MYLIPFAPGFVTNLNPSKVCALVKCVESRPMALKDTQTESPATTSVASEKVKFLRALRLKLTGKLNIMLLMAE